MKKPYAVGAGVVSSEHTPALTSEKKTVEELVQEFESLYQDSIAADVAALHERLYLRDRYYPAPEDLEVSVQRELQFTARVIERVAAWIHEGMDALLWDIDSTLAFDRMNYNTEEIEFFFRPSATYLLQYLRQTYPNLKLGVLSYQGLLKEGLSDPDRLAPIASYIDDEMLFTARDYPMAAEVVTIMDAGDPITYYSEEEQGKLSVLFDLIGGRRGIECSARAVDDAPFAKRYPDLFLYVAEFQ